MTRVLLVGGGLTSALTGAILRRELPHVELVLWDKSRGAGMYRKGRFRGIVGLV